MAMNILTPIGVLSFPVLFTPRPPAPNAEPRFQINLLFDKKAQASTAYADLKRGVLKVIDDKWGQGKSQDKAFIGKLRLPFRPTAEKDYKGYDIEGGIFIMAWSKNKPGVVDAQRTEIVVPGDIWPGQLVRATVSPFAYQNTGNLGVSFGLNNVQVCRTDGERLDGRKAATEDFPDYEDENATDDQMPF
jgi:hypothetical protein